MSPKGSPGLTGVSTARPSVTTNTTSLSPRRVMAEAGTASRGLVSSGVRARERKATLALISGSTRGSSVSKRTLTRTVALVRSAVGTIMESQGRLFGQGQGQSVEAVLRILQRFLVEEDQAEDAGAQKNE